MHLPGVTDTAPSEKKGNKHLIIGSDTNAHHTEVKSSDISKRIVSINICSETMSAFSTLGALLLLYVEIVKDIGVGTSLIEIKVSNWLGSRKASVSDHRHIRFDLRVAVV